MQGHGEKLSRKMEHAISALLTEPTVEAAARAVGVNPVTLWRWMQRPEFQKAYERARRQVLDRAIHALQTASEGAVRTLVFLKDHAEKETVKLGAARALLDFALTAGAIRDIEERLTRLERLIEERAGAREVRA